MKFKEITLNSGQGNAARMITKWWNKEKEYKQVFVLSGVAGSGKSTCASYIVNMLGLKYGDVLYITYTGKASLVLMQKGNNSQTIHSAIYHTILVDDIDEHGNIIKIHGRNKKKYEFTKRPYIDGVIKLIIVDEWSMVDDKLGKDIVSFGIPILCLGDENQLDPVFGKPYFQKEYGIDFRLTEPMRQAQGSPVIHLATKVLRGEDIPFGKYGNSLVIPPHLLNDNMLMGADMIISGTNKTRREINNHIRNNLLGIRSQEIIVGDKVICLQNNRNVSTNIMGQEIYLVNGMVGYVDEIHKRTLSKDGKTVNIDFRPEFSDYDKFMNISFDREYFKQPYDGRSFSNKFDLGHCLTAHKAQGSEWDNVVVIEDGFGGSKLARKKWLYSAITRTKYGIILVRKTERTYG